MVHAKGGVQMHETIDLDGFDWRLLAALQDDASLTNAALAERIGLSASQVSRRRQRLEAAGVIRGYRADLDAPRLGLGVTVFIHVALNAHSRDNARRLRDLVHLTPAILEAHALTGEADYLMKVMVGDLRELSQLVNDVLLPHEAIARLRSEIVLETLKDASGLPLPGPG
ncbi:Lrp/AsnC family transcriptional regulator [Chelatococcus sp. SYSU_G07232]|uniref:Lrp/AsnC family transcriptional regulator n=1 Tax=Chelatococcus albus TaxID=3047466 RepID=A0ABT7ALE4_9HYPH|nr:Lrp/AsnC family transcriptional regulator [Chelatococcus sp. SYSU_G07232]MDJ1160202.1 Lrp/AsnC family transcriptional regulator [Chelatococcus sp. SYSU_G07232]